jgi:hypothetical protein
MGKRGYGRLVGERDKTALASFMRVNLNQVDYESARWCYRGLANEGYPHGSVWWRFST